MARLSLVDHKQMSPQYAQLVERVKSADGYVNFLSMMAHRQEVVEPMWRAYVDMFEEGVVEPPLKELVRIKIAYLNGCLFWQGFRYASVMRKGLTEEKIAQLEDYENSPAFTPREKSALRFAEKLAIDYDSIDNDEFFIGLQQHFTDAEIVELGIVIGYDIAFGRLLRVFDADPKVCEVPEHREVGVDVTQSSALSTAK